MAITFRDQKGAPLTHEELDANFRSFFFTASFGENNLTLQRKDGVTVNVPVGGEAFANFQANGGSIGDVFIANSQITGSRIIIDLLQGQFYDKTKGPNSDGGDLSSDEWYIDFDPAASSPYYVHFGSNFAISSSGYLHASGAVIEGDITASSGLIAGFGITPDAITGPTFFISGSAGVNDHFISASNLSIKGSGDITGSAVLFSGGTIAGWDITNSQIRKSTNIVLDATNESVSIKSSTFGNEGIQLQYNSGTPRFYVGDGSNSFVKYDGTDVNISTRLLEISASNIEISSTEASMSLGDGAIELLGEQGKITAGTTNKVRIEGNNTDAFLVAGTKTGFASNDAGIIIGMDSNVPTLDLTKDANNYVRFTTSNGVDIKTDTFKLDTTYFDIDSTTQRVNIFNTASKELVRLGEISDDASDLYGLKIYDGAGTGSSNTIAMFGQQGNKIGGWEVTGDQIRSIPAAGFGGSYASGETGLIIHSDGTLESSNFVTNVKGWRIDTAGNGSAEFENMRIRGTLKTTVFEKESVNVVGGQLMVANATTIQPLRSADGTIIAGSSSYADTAVTFSVANVSGFAEGEIIKAKSVDATGFSVEYMYVSGSARYSENSSLSYNTGSIDPDGLAGEIYVQRAFGGTPAVSSSITTISADIANTTSTLITVATVTGFNLQDIIKIDNERLKVTAINTGAKRLTVIRGYHDTVADSHTSGDTVFKVDTQKEFLSGLVSTAQAYNEGQVLVSTGVYNPATDISSGYIMMNANPRDVSTPYMDIVERTGSGVYDLELRSRLGDLSGLSSGYLYGNNEPGFGLYTENGFFKGSITADTGSIAGILHVATVAGGLETGQKISIGRDVSGTNDGIFVNNNNYWYTDGAWKVGGSDNFISLDNFTDGNLTIRTETFTLDTPTFMISSSLNSGTLTAGTNANTITTTTGTGIYMDGTGKFRAGTATSGDNYIYWDGTNLNIKGAIDITGGTGVNTAELNAATSSLSGSLATEISASDATLSGSIATTSNTLDAKIFTDSSGRAVRPPTASAEGLYMSSTNLGYYKSGAWKTYMDNTGDFFLTGSNNGKLAWDSATGNLEIKGSITITGGNAATQDYVNTATGSLSGSLAADLSASNAELSGSISSSNASLTSQIDAVDTLASGKTSIFKQANAPSTTGRINGDMWIDSNDQNKVYIFNSGNSQWETTPDGTYDQTDLINSTSSSLSASVALDIFTDATGKLVRPPSTASAGTEGLFLGDSNLGFYSGSEWKTYMANNGNFYLTGSDSNYLFWDGTSLNIAGSINITSGNAATTSSVESAAANAVTSGSNAAASALSDAQSYTNEATSSLSGSLVSTIDTVSGSLASGISASNATTLEISASQASVNEGVTGFLAGKNSIFRQNNEPTSSGRVDGDIWIDTNSTPANKVYVWATDAFVATPDGTYDQSGDINSLSGSVAADTFTDSTGKIVRTPNPSGEGLFLGDSNLGFYSQSQWQTFMANNGNFFLTGSDGGYLKWQNGALDIKGAINITGGNAATQQDVNTATGSLSASLSESIADEAVIASASAATAQTTATNASVTAATATQTALTASARTVNADGKVVFNPAPSGQGLFMNSNNLGFYNNNYWGAYISASGEFFLSGSGNSGLSWDGTALSVDGTVDARDGTIGGITLDSDKMYSGTGTHGAANTPFFTSQSGEFSLGNKLVWDGSDLTIEGSITVTNANDFASQQELDDMIATTSSLANPSTYKFGPSAAFTLDAVTPSSDGLYLGSNNLGYYSASAWRAYMDSSGNFLLTGNGDDGLTWNGSTLRIGNKGVGPSLAYQFSGSLNSDVFDSSITSIITMTSPVLGVKLYNNADGWDEGLHSTAVFDRKDGGIFEWDIVVGPANARGMFGLYEESPSSFSHTQMIHAIYFDSDQDIHIYEKGSNRGTLVSNDWNNNPNYSENQQYRLRIQPLSTGARFEIFKNGDYTTPAYTFDSAASGVTDRYFRPGIAIHNASTSGTGFIVQAMAGGTSLGQATKISGNTIQTGVLESSNLSTTLGSQFNLNDGTFKLGGTSSPKLNWNGSTLSVVGNITVTNPDSFATPAEKNKADFRLILLATGSAGTTNTVSMQYLSSQGYTGGNSGTHFYDNNNQSDGNTNPANISGFDTNDYDLYVFDNRNWATDANEAQLALNLFDLGKSVLSVGNDTGVLNVTGSYNTQWPITNTQSQNSMGWMSGRAADGRGLPASHPILAGGLVGGGSTSVGVSSSSDSGLLIRGLKAFPKGGTVVQPFVINGGTTGMSTTNDIFVPQGTGSGILGFIATNARGGRLVHLNMFGLSTTGTYGALSTQAAKNLTSFLLRTDPAIEAHYMQVTSITGEMVTTGKINSSNLNEGSGTYTTAGTLFDLDNGAIKSKSFAIDSSGNANFKGDISGASGTFSGILSATEGAIGGYTISTNKLYAGTDQNTGTFTSAPGDLIISSSGAIHSNKFYIDHEGNAGFKGSLSGADISGATGTFAGTVSVGGQNLDSVIAQTDQTSLFPNPNFTTVNPNDTTRPQGVFAAYGGAATTNVKYENDDADAAVLEIGSGTDSTTGAAFQAFPVVTGQTYKFYIRMKASGTSSTGLYIRVYEKNSNTLGVGNLAISNNSSDSEGVVVEEDATGTLSNRTIDGSSAATFENIGINTTYKVYQFTYTPSSNAKWASLVLLSWAGMGSHRLRVSRMSVIPVGSDVYTGVVGGWTMDSTAIFTGTKDSDKFTTSGITLSAGGSIHSPNFYISESGDAVFRGMVTGSEIKGTVVSGSTVQGGTVAGATIVGSQIFVPNSLTSSFSVDADGIMSASGAHMVGTMTATDGKIGDWIIDGETNSLRDDNTEIELFPGDALAGPEIRMFSGSEKKLVLSPEGELTNVGSANTTTVSMNTSVPSFSVSSNSSNTSFNYVDKYFVTSSTSFTPTAPGAYLVNVNQVFGVPEMPGSPNPDASTFYPNYQGTNGQWHGYAFLTRKGHTVNWYLQAVKSNGTVVGETSIGSGFAYSQINSYTYYVYGEGDGIGGQQSVTGDTLITLSNGTTKLAKDVLQTDKILAWDWINNTGFVESEINQLIARHDADIYEVETQSGKIIRVSDSHGFWLDNNKQVKVLELKENISQIYLVENDVLMSDTVVRVEKLETTEDVFTFSIPQFENYISNGILSHNPSASWGAETSDVVTAYSGSTALEYNKQHSITISEAVAVKFRYRMKVGARSGTDVTTSSSGTQSTSYLTTTFNNFHTGVGTNPSGLDSTITIEQPSNFVEVKAGGVQVVSSDSKYIKMSRLNNTGGDTDILFQAEGGTMETHHIKPRLTGQSTLGISSRKWDGLYVNYINSTNSSSVKMRPLTYLREGSKSIYYSTFPSDSIHTVSFTSVGTSTYKVIGQFVGSNSNDYNNQNDAFVTIFSKTSTSFKIGIRDIASQNGTMYFEYFLVEGA